MRIGLVCPYSFDAPGGVQNHVLGLARQLARAGHQPHILAPGLFPELVEGRREAAGRVEFTSAGQAIAVPYNGSIARVNFGPLSATRVRRWLRAGDFDLVHIHEPITPSIALLALWAADVPVVATFHTATPRSRTMQLAGGALRASIEKIDAGIAVSESARRVVVHHLGRDAMVIPNGFDFAAFAPPPPEKWAQTTATRRVNLSPPPSFPRSRRPRVTFLGRVDEPRKGLDVLLRALPAIRAGLGDVDVVVAGQGSISAPAGIRLLGAISDEDKAQLLRGSDVFVAPHRERESFGIVLLEAMAAGASVVASALPAFADLLRPADLLRTEGGSDPLGELVPIGDASALAEAVLATVRRPPPGRTARARERARRYDWSEVAPAITAVYHATLATTAPTRRVIAT
jgi:phosphatidylinositol alpha-mannosyltransferase